ncbi:hypothetical protein [Sphingomonas glacialis]|uniref:Uncharacterized protein n=1 Tax=Sphingomonas glacialis TaxID=658225 RepID=A0A502FFT5_9SPHN|nr:hypothetical protein [Sphingomonas glacialis]TPG48300.1 hypothetical protein EAH76_21080 [Sphingomonas glacialis]
MAEERNTLPTETAHISPATATATATAEDELKGLLSYKTVPGTLKFIVQNLQAACERTRHRDVGDSEQTDPPHLTKAPTPSASTAGSGSVEAEETLAAVTGSVIGTELVSTDTWWAQRWIDKATPGEIAAMRELLVPRG